MNFHQIVLPNGIEVVAETRESARSAAVGFFVRAGARDETTEEAGVSHFLEHMAFKGNERRSAEDVNREFDEIGANYNAYTSEEFTVYYAVVLPKFLPRAIDLLAGLLRPSLRSDDFEVEQKVILEEIGQHQDSPPSRLQEEGMRLHFLDHPMGNSVLGSIESVSGLTPERMRAYHERRYAPGNIKVVATGNVHWPDLVDWVANHCGNWQGTASGRCLVREHARGPARLLVDENLGQETVFWLADAPAADSAHILAADLLTEVIGGETGSRLYWELDEPGLVDSVDFGYASYEGIGLYYATLSCVPEDTEANIARVEAIFSEIMEHGVRAEELERAANKVAARLVFAAERPSNRLGRVAYNWWLRREYRALERDLGEIATVTPAIIRALLEDYPLGPFTRVAIGPLPQLADLATA